jgi:hypothetical protein
VVLSLEEFDMAIRLVEFGHPFDQLIFSLASRVDSFNPLMEFANELKVQAVSSFVFRKGKTLMDTITHAPDQGVRQI